MFELWRNILKKMALWTQNELVNGANRELLCTLTSSLSKYTISILHSKRSRGSSNISCDHHHRMVLVIKILRMSIITQCHRIHRTHFINSKIRHKLAIFKTDITIRIQRIKGHMIGPRLASSSSSLISTSRFYRIEAVHHLQKTELVRAHKFLCRCLKFQDKCKYLCTLETIS